MGSYMLTNININETSLRNVNKLDFGKLYTISGTSFITSLYQNDKKIVRLFIAQRPTTRRVYLYHTAQVILD